MIRTFRPLLVCSACLMFAASLLAAAVPVPISDIVNDYAGVLGRRQSEELEAVLRRVQKQTGVGITLVTVPSLKDYQERASQVDSFSTLLFNQWGIGQRQINNGVLILLSVKDRLVRFEFGSDYEPEDIAALQTSIKGQVLPLFSENNFAAGIHASAMYAIQAVTDPISFWTYHKTEIRWGVFALASLIGCLHFYSLQKPSLTWVFFALTGIFLFLSANTVMTKSHDPGFGGGMTAGLGFTEKWPTV